MTPGRRAAPVMLAAMLAAAGLLVFSRAAWNGFITLDDPSYILENPHVRDGFTAEGIRWAFTTTFEGNWDPLTWTSHMLDVELFGLDPAGHHMTSVVLHVANAVLLFFLLHGTTASPLRSAFAAALFLLHPLRVEPVAWAAERKELLCAFFSILTLQAYVFYVRSSRRRWQAAALAAFLLALLSKPMAMTLPFVLLLFDAWPLSRLSFADTTSVARRAVEKVPFVVPAVAVAVVAWLAQRDTGAFPSLPFWARAGNALIGYAAYLGKTIWPTGLSVYYPHPGAGLPVGTAIACGVLLVALTAAAWIARRRPYVPVGWMWYLGTLVPVIGFVQFGGHAMADRFTYFPLIGIFVLVSWGIPDALRGARLRTWILPSCATVVLLVLATVTWIQLGRWRDDLTLFRHAVDVDDANWVAQNTLGGLLGRDGRIDEAIPHFRKAIEAFPEYAEAHFNLGVALNRKGNIDEAVSHYREALRLEPGNADRRMALADALERSGRPEDAVRELREVLRLRPGDAEARERLEALTRPGAPPGN